jgi:hypothetical protein
MVHPDGSEQHDVPLTLPLLGRPEPSWSPDGPWIVFSSHARRHRKHLHGAAGRHLAHTHHLDARCRRAASGLDERGLTRVRRLDTRPPLERESFG